MNDTLQIRPATYEDADAIFALTMLAYGEYRDTPAPSSALAETIVEVRERLRRGEFHALIALQDDIPVASVRYKLDASGLYFFRLAVHPEWRRQGLAHALVSRLEEEAKRGRAHRLWCQVRLIVPRNVALYTGLGFEIVEQHVVMRGAVEVPVATMQKRLTPPLKPNIATARIPLPPTPSPTPLVPRWERGSEEAERSGPTCVVLGQRVVESKVELSKAMGRAMTPEEDVLWQRLRRNAVGGLKFRRQQVIGGYIADFYCHSAALAVELDGAYHEAEYDEHRDRAFEQFGIRVLRFPNDAVRSDLDAVVAKITEAALQGQEAIH